MTAPPTRSHISATIVDNLVAQTETQQAQALRIELLQFVIMANAALQGPETVEWSVASSVSSGDGGSSEEEEVSTTSRSSPTARARASEARMRGRIHAFGVALQRALGDATRVEALDNNAAVWAQVWMAMARQTNGATGRVTAASAAAAPSTSSSSSLPPRPHVPEHRLQNLGHVNPLAMVPRVRGVAPQPEHATQPRLLEAAPRESSTTQHPPQGSTALVTSNTSTVDNSQPKLHQALHTIEVHQSCRRHVSDCSLAHRPCTTALARSRSLRLCLLPHGQLQTWRQS